MPEPLLALVMIVRNEAASIAATIASVRDHVDAWLILDTGSTDGTQELARQAFGAIPGAVIEEPFVDFATSRNRALDLAKGKATYALMLSGDETLEGGAALRAHLAARQHDPTCPGAYYSALRLGATAFPSVRISRIDSPWRYVGPVHEVMIGPEGRGAGPAVAGVAIVHDEAAHIRSNAGRWARDLGLLAAELARNPDCTRTTFYHAQTLACMGRHQEAYDGYARRVALGGWAPERYEAQMRMGWLAGVLGQPWAVSQQHYLEAHAIAPEMAEPLHKLAQHYHAVDPNAPDGKGVDQHGPCFLFASAAASKPYPADWPLFIDAALYRNADAADLAAIHAWYLGEFEAGERFARMALAARPEDAHRAKNLAWYLGRKAGQATAPTTVSVQRVVAAAAQAAPRNRGEKRRQRGRTAA